MSKIIKEVTTITKLITYDDSPDTDPVDPPVPPTPPTPPVTPTMKADPKDANGKPIALTGTANKNIINGNWNGDLKLPFDYIREGVMSDGSKTVLFDVTFDYKEEARINRGENIVRLDIRKMRDPSATCTLLIDPLNGKGFPARLNLIDYGKDTTSNQDNISSFAAGKNYWIDINQRILGEGLDLVQIRMYLIGVYLHTKDFASDIFYTNTTDDGLYLRTANRPWVGRT